MTTPYAEGPNWEIYNGDALEIMPLLEPTHIVTDPVWPNCPTRLGWPEPWKLFAGFCKAIPASVERIAIILGCVSDPRFLFAIPGRFQFFRVIHLRYALPARIGRTLINADYAYLYGPAPTPKEGRRIVPGEITVADQRELHEHSFGPNGHPCPRRLKHVAFVVEHFCRDIDIILDPFCGSGTTLLAAAERGFKSIGIEINERYCEVAARRLSERPILIT